MARYRERVQRLAGAALAAGPSSHRPARLLLCVYPRVTRLDPVQPQAVVSLQRMGMGRARGGGSGAPARQGRCAAGSLRPPACSPPPARASGCSWSPPARLMPSDVMRLALSSTSSSTTRPFHVSKKRDSGTSTSLHSPLLRGTEAWAGAAGRGWAHAGRHSTALLAGCRQHHAQEPPVVLPAAPAPTAQTKRPATRHGCGCQPASSRNARWQCTAARRPAPCGARARVGAGGGAALETLVARVPALTAGAALLPMHVQPPHRHACTSPFPS